MAIDPNTEHVLSLSAAVKDLPTRRRGKRPHVSCAYRWTTTGCRGVVLESIQIGGTRCTSREALARFFEKLTAASNPAGHKVISTERREQRQKRAAEKASQELEREGC